MDGGKQWARQMLAAARRFLLLPAGFVLCPMAAAAEPPQSERLINIDLEYSASLESLAKPLGAYVDRVKPSFSQYMQENVRAFQKTLEARREEDLAFVCKLLNLPAATPAMQDVYDFYLNQWFPKLAPVLDFKKLEVWDERDLRARLAAGEPLPGHVGYEPALDRFYVMRAMRVEGQVTMVGRQEQGKDLRFTGAGGAAAEVSITRIIGERDLRAPDLFAREKRSVQREIGMLTDPAGAHNPFVAGMTVIAIHETTEYALVKYVINSSDRRWFAEGVANFAAYKRLAEKQGEETSRQTYAMHYSPQKLGPLLGKVDLFAWPAVENEEKGAPDGDLRLAHYYLATEVVREMAARHGDDIFTRIFQRLPPPAAGGPVARLGDVQAAYQELTGRDLRQLVASVQARLDPAVRIGARRK